jgi:hypothetical protein
MLQPLEQTKDLVGKKFEARNPKLETITNIKNINSKT